MFLSRILIQRCTGRYRYVLDRKCAMHLFDHSITVDVLCRLNCSVGISAVRLLYKEYQSVCPFVGIGSPHLPPRTRLWLPPGSKWGGGTHSLAGEIVGVPNSDEGTETLVPKCILQSLYGCTVPRS
jgi:hypothetical protein